MPCLSPMLPSETDASADASTAADATAAADAGADAAASAGKKRIDAGLQPVPKPTALPLPCLSPPVRPPRNQ
jgi:hypothetical protein